MESNVKQLRQCLCRGYEVNGGWFGAETDRIKCETAWPVLVSGCVVELASQLILMDSVMKLLCHSLCRGT